MASFFLENLGLDLQLPKSGPWKRRSIHAKVKARNWSLSVKAEIEGTYFLPRCQLWLSLTGLNLSLPDYTYSALVLLPTKGDINDPCNTPLLSTCIITLLHTCSVIVSSTQWNLIATVTYGPKVCGCNRELAALQRYKCIQSYHLKLELGGLIMRWLLYRVPSILRLYYL